MKNYNDVWYQSSDGLKLYARDYANDDAKLTLLCMHGLTRNSADFEELCDELQSNYRVVAVDQRGRGKSDYDSNCENYQPVTYVQDMLLLIDKLQLKNIVMIGTSMGGLMAMMMAAMKPDLFSGTVINDIGPEVDPAGIARIKSYVGKGSPVTTWDEAVSRSKLTGGIAFPNFDDSDWLWFTKKLYGENEQGVPELLYDPAIATPIANNEDNAVPPDLWPLYEAVAQLPLLIIRGELSDILSKDCATEMLSRQPEVNFVEVTEVGHAPTLREPQSLNAIRDFLGDLSS